jgi:hypothetical protein
MPLHLGDLETAFYRFWQVGKGSCILPFIRESISNQVALNRHKVFVEVIDSESVDCGPGRAVSRREFFEASVPFASKFDDYSDFEVALNAAVTALVKSITTQEKKSLSSNKTNILFITNQIFILYLPFQQLLIVQEGFRTGLNWRINA